MIKNELQKRIFSSLILIPIALFFIIKGSFLFTFFILICFLITSYEWHKMSYKKPYYLLGLLFLALSFYSAYEIREYKEPENLELFLYVLVVCVSTDIGGYIFGKIFKGPKLTKISPKKTYAGVFGGFILSLVAALIYLKYTSNGLTSYFNLSILSDSTINKIYILFVLVISFISQIGDLIISYFKRLAKIKDTGNLLPGHGGLLDRVDGIIFAIPASYLLIYYLIK